MQTKYWSLQTMLDQLPHALSILDEICWFQLNGTRFGNQFFKIHTHFTRVLRTVSWNLLYYLSINFRFQSVNLIDLYL